MAKKPDDTALIACVVFFSGIVGIETYSHICRLLKHILLLKDIV